MWPSRIGTYPSTNSAVCLRMLPPECSRERRGRNGMNNLECRYRLCLGASFPMAHSVPSLAISLVDDCDVQLGNPEVLLAYRRGLVSTARRPHLLLTHSL